MDTKRGSGVVLLVVAMALLVGCGPSSADIKRARGASYGGEAGALWPEIVAAVKERYPRLVTEDGAAGVIVSDWHLVERTVDEQQTAYGVQAGRNTKAGRFFRVAVKLEGGPPWRVVVDGEAADYRPGMSVLKPYAHGEAGEPGWVQGRIDALTVAIDERLARHRLPATP